MSDSISGIVHVVVSIGSSSDSPSSCCSYSCFLPSSCIRRSSTTKHPSSSSISTKEWLSMSMSSE
ncbi:UPF0481 protein-like [Iris pallida]|uniref:UPF0481 protein-like n=1 Tax=Iris pallida TaxID=29817 RepID=A0AAX6E9I2_IRIPA|nr:UPF0481 protein-like [Iris pallida]